jgi:hypothetical protein
LITSSFMCISCLKVAPRLEIDSFILEISWPLCLPVIHRMQIETLQLSQRVRIKAMRNMHGGAGNSLLFTMSTTFLRDLQSAAYQEQSVTKS